MNQFNCKQIKLDNMFCRKIFIKNICVLIIKGCVLKYD